jgi:eukaryotic-like serine/threonine-protein kinase
MKPGDILRNNLRLERVVGEGALGVVWLATNTLLGAQVAVKVLKPDPAVTIAGGALREASIVARISNPHIVQVHDVGATEDGQNFIVMEYLEGEDLAQRLERQKQLPPALVAHIIQQAAQGLAVAHAKGVVHRDIKPSNLFLIEGEAGPWVKLLDFGIAKTRLADLETITTHDATIGTPAYMSPEQILSARDVDLSTDLWSLAVVTYVGLTGTLPFKGATTGARWLAISNRRFERASVIAPELGPQIDAWFSRAFQLDPRERYGSARELAEALHVALGIAAPRSAEAEFPHVVSPSLAPERIGKDATFHTQSTRAEALQASEEPLLEPGHTQQEPIEQDEPIAPAPAQAARSSDAPRWPIAVLALGAALAVGLLFLRRAPPTPAMIVASQTPALPVAAPTNAPSVPTAQALATTEAPAMPGTAQASAVAPSSKTKPKTLATTRATQAESPDKDLGPDRGF